MIELAVLKSMTPGAYGIWVLVILAVLTAIKAWPRLKEMQLGADGSLRTDLLARISQLETQVGAMETAQTEERERHQAEMQILRHRLNNETASLDALLLLLETNPDRTIESIAKIKELRAVKAQQIALEQGAMAGKVKG